MIEAGVCFSVLLKRCKPVVMGSCVRRNDERRDKPGHDDGTALRSTQKQTQRRTAPALSSRVDSLGRQDWQIVSLRLSLASSI